MNFFGLLNSLDEILYEFMSWLLFYPITLWRSLRHPLAMMDYADVELADAEEEQYTDTLSPPLFLLLSLVISHALELTLVGQNSLVTDNKGLAAFVSDDTSLIMLRIVFFSIFALVMAVRLLRKQGKKVERKSLREPFYSQCYVVAPFALLTGIAVLMTTSRHDGFVLAGVAMLLLTLCWYGILQTLWFSQQLGIGKARAFGQASLGMIESLIAVAILSVLFR